MDQRLRAQPSATEWLAFGRLVWVWCSLWLGCIKGHEPSLGRAVVFHGPDFSLPRCVPGALGDARNALYGEEPLSVGINALAFLEGGLGILFLFLIGLVLRNRFRI